MSHQSPNSADRTRLSAALTTVRKRLGVHDWAPSLVPRDAIVLVLVLSVCWLLFGPQGVLVWIAVTIVWAVLPAVIAVAIGVVAIGGLAVSADTPLLIAMFALLIGILVRDSLKSGWEPRVLGVYFTLTGGLTVIVYILTLRTTPLITGLVFLSLLIGGVVGLARFVPEDKSQHVTSSNDVQDLSTGSSTSDE
ncbi:hypothetical protein [Halobellus sp. EA9]|uniref:hypothetical protein n=1 Tax=Halobellus sp. EA9 TaxID=3421647 RepID=UPI003EBFE506